MTKKNKKIDDILKKNQQKYNLPYLGVINLNQDFRLRFQEKLREKFIGEPGFLCSEYIKKTLNTRLDPGSIFPWAKSIFVFAIPFHKLPLLKNPLPLAKDNIFAGRIAGYATRQDYHIGGENIVKTFMDQIEADCRYEICIDTKPVAERALGIKAGLGEIGQNFSLLTSHDGSGCFLVECFTDLDIEYPNQSKFELKCNNCNLCKKQCITGALNSKGYFNYENCRSYLNMEKRGMLSMEQGRLLGDWLFGCDDCTACCPGSKLPKSTLIDLEWLLMSPSSAIRKQITGTALEYAGVTMLRRNGLFILGNKRAQKAFDLINDFSHQTRSQLLRDTAERIMLKQQH